MQFTEKATQAEIGRAIGVSERSVRKFLKKQGINHKDFTLGEIILKYIEALRETASGRDFGDVNITKEKGLLLKAKRKLAERKLNEEEERSDISGYLREEKEREKIEMLRAMSDQHRKIIEFLMITTKTAPSKKLFIEFKDSINALDKTLKKLILKCTKTKTLD